MFWGSVIKEAQPLKSQKILETSEFAALHLSKAIVAKPSDATTRLFVKCGKDADVCIASLTKQRDEVSLDHYINCTQHITLSVRGPAEVHLSGYFEPKGDDMEDDDMFYGGADEDEDEADSASDEEAAAGATKKGAAKQVQQSLVQAKMNSQKNAGKQAVAVDSDEEDVDDYDDEEEFEEDLSDLPDDEDLSEEEDSEGVPPPRAQV